MQVATELLGRHGGYILASYAATFLIMGVLVWTSLRRYADAKRRHTAAIGIRHD